MKKTYMNRPRTLSSAEQTSLLETIQHILWPEADTEHEWNFETIKLIAEAMHSAGLSPVDSV